MSSTSWTFGPGGIYTATWDGIDTLTVTYTSGGTFVESFSGQSLAALMSAPAFLALAASPSAGAPQLVATTATLNPSGFALQNGTGTIISWTAPNDGAMHRVHMWIFKYVTVQEVGGSLTISWTLPNGVSTGQIQIDAGNAGAGFVQIFDQPWNFLIQANTTFTLRQNGALTGGASKVWAEIWGS